MAVIVHGNVHLSVNYILCKLYFNKDVKKKINAFDKVCWQQWCMKDRNMAKPTALFLVSATGRKSSWSDLQR